MPDNSRVPVSPVAEDLDVGDDSDLAGLDQPVTGDDIDALAMSGRGTVAERREALLGLRDDLSQRAAMDETGDDSDLVARIDEALAALAGAPEGVGTPGAYGHDAADRAMSPDEILERDEEEQQEDT